MKSWKKNLVLCVSQAEVLLVSVLELESFVHFRSMVHFTISSYCSNYEVCSVFQTMLNYDCYFMLDDIIIAF